MGKITFNRRDQSQRGSDNFTIIIVVFMLALVLFGVVTGIKAIKDSLVPTYKNTHLLDTGNNEYAVVLDSHDVTVFIGSVEVTDTNIIQKLNGYPNRIIITTITSTIWADENVRNDLLELSRKNVLDMYIEVNKDRYNTPRGLNNPKRELTNRSL